VPTAALPAKAVPLKDNKGRFGRVLPFDQLEQRDEANASAAPTSKLQTLAFLETPQCFAVVDSWIWHVASPLGHIVENVVWPLFPFARSIHDPHSSGPVSDRVGRGLYYDLQFIRPATTPLIPMIAGAFAFALQPREEVGQGKAAINLREHHGREHDQATAIAAVGSHLENTEISKCLRKDAGAWVDIAHARS
jgi:hypothetical protein